MLVRVGARRWVFAILLAWGAISAAHAFVQGPASFYILRFLLGVAEAGLFPGVVLYLTTGSRRSVAPAPLQASWRQARSRSSSSDRSRACCSRWTASLH